MRIKPRELAKARWKSALLPLLLPTVRDTNSAQLELKWLKESIKNPAQLRRACISRGKFNYPLQYILGTQPFGSLDILCKSGVLIPRWETEEWSLNLCRLINSNHAKGPRETGGFQSSINMVDFCTGTGCVPLVLAKECGENIFNKIYGVDISPHAISLFQDNIKFNSSDHSKNIVYPILGNVFHPQEVPGLPPSVDLVTANPPYIKYGDFMDPSQTERSVRLHEPELALVGGTEFYKAIFNFACKLKAKAIVMEVGNLDQIKFVESLLLDANSDWDSCRFKDSAGSFRGINIWRKSSEWKFLKAMGHEKPETFSSARGN